VGNSPPGSWKITQSHLRLCHRTEYAATASSAAVSHRLFSVLIMKSMFFSSKALERALLLACTALVLGMFIFSFSRTPLYFQLVAEDNFIENLTAILLFATGLLCAGRAFGASSRPAVLFYAACSLLFMFGAGEEISWGQRILGFSTPETLQAHNFQKEFTLHNLTLWGFDWNRVIFGTGLYTAVLSFYLLFPLVYRRNKRFQRLADRLQFPIPKWKQSLPYVSLFLLLHFIPRHSGGWELQEFMLSGFLLISYLFPYNLARFRPRQQSLLVEGGPHYQEVRPKSFS
jgi:hypothetical protein